MTTFTNINFNIVNNRNIAFTAPMNFVPAGIDYNDEYCVHGARQTDQTEQREIIQIS